MSEDKARGHPAIVCRCMDITEEEMLMAFKVMVRFLGTADPDTYRRISSATTGYCQGRGCLQHMQRYLAKGMRELGMSLDMDRLVPRKRSPLQPVPMGLFYNPEVLKE